MADRPDGEERRRRRCYFRSRLSLAADSVRRELTVVVHNNEVPDEFLQLEAEGVAFWDAVVRQNRVSRLEVRSGV